MYSEQYSLLLPVSEIYIHGSVWCPDMFCSALWVFFLRFCAQLLVIMVCPFLLCYFPWMIYHNLLIQLNASEYLVCFQSGAIMLIMLLSTASLVDGSWCTCTPRGSRKEGRGCLGNFLIRPPWTVFFKPVVSICDPTRNDNTAPRVLAFLLLSHLYHISCRCDEYVAISPRGFHLNLPAY